MPSLHKRPLIGLTSASYFLPDWTERAPARITDFAARDYSHGVENAGGLPVLIPSARTPETVVDVLDRLDGLLLTGGVDVCPGFYGQEPLPGLKDLDHGRDLTELALARAAAARQMPILGICRGAQLLNVALGGSLYQDIYSQIPGCQNHTPRSPKQTNTHTVKLTPGSRLHQLAGVDSLWVNSQHHQAVKDLAPGLMATAWAADGVVEAVEAPDFPFMLAVQWHPEGTWPGDPVSAAIFRSFIEAAAAGLNP
ncbi:MAG: gamma-glutamyl-gamma-aminobutyrate hydrolase family protein [Pseudomonadota bacterium]